MTPAMAYLLAVSRAFALGYLIGTNWPSSAGRGAALLVLIVAIGVDVRAWRRSKVAAPEGN